MRCIWGKHIGTAIVLAAGQGKRMGTKVHKQYLLLGDRPVLYYSLKAFEDSPLIDEVFLITGAGEEEYCRENIVNPYHFTKVSRIMHGGAERYHSVWNGLQELRNMVMSLFTTEPVRLWTVESSRGLTRKYRSTRPV